MFEEDARVMQMHQVEKAAPALSGAVGGIVSYVLGLDAVVLSDGEVSSGAMGRSVGDVSVSSRVVFDTVVSGAVSGCLCDIDSVSRGDIIVRVGEMSLS